VGPYLLHQHDFDLETDFRLYAVLVALYVKDDSVLTQDARARVSSLDVCRPTPICLLYLANPRVERRSYLGVLHREFTEELFSD